MNAHSTEFQNFYELAKQAIDAFGGIRTVGFGDVMLDRWWTSSVVRPNPESATGFDLLNPTMTQTAGGAANVAVNVSALGGVCYLVGVVGKDADADALTVLLSKQPRTRFVTIEDPTRRTTSKTRYYSESNGIARISFESLEDVGWDVAKQCIEALENGLDHTTALWVEDYGKGVIQGDVVQCLKQLRSNNPKTHIVFDPKTGHGGCYQPGMCTLLKPNWKEALDLVGETDAFADREDVARRLGKKFECDVLITLGGDGSVVYEKATDTITFVRTRAVEDRDVTGAGDTIVAMLALALSAGLSLLQSAILANCAAGVVVRKTGTASVLPAELLAELAQPEMQEIVSSLFRSGALRAA